MKRSGFKRPVIERRPVQLHRLTRACTPAVIDAVPRTVPKDAPVRSEAYRRLVAALPCMHCGAQGLSQAAHPNTGKGAGMKADDRHCFPLCADRIAMPGCHRQFDQGALFPKELRRELEQHWGAATRAAIKAAGDWPSGLPEI